MRGLVTISLASPRTRGRAFTLVELLLVIGIIALLIGILVPMLSRARAQANRTMCLSNIRQLGQAIRMYCEDHSGYVPTRAVHDDGVAFMPYPEDWVHWQQNRDINDSAIVRYVARGEKLKRVLRCPSDSFDGRKPAPAAVPGQGPYLYSYNLNGSVGVNGRGPFPLGRPERTKINQWRAPSRKILITEMAEDINTSASWPHTRLARRHGTGNSRGTGETPAGRLIGINVSAVFFDGHAEATDEDYARRPVFHGRADSEKGTFYFFKSRMSPFSPILESSRTSTSWQPTSDRPTGSGCTARLDVRRRGRSAGFQ